MSLSVSQIQQAYIAFFNRPADVSGLNFWLNFPGDQTALLNQFSASSEYLDEYWGMSNEQVVNKVYQNLFGRSAETEGLNYWVGELEAGWVDIGNVAYAIMHGARNSDAATIDNKTSAAIQFTDALDTPTEEWTYAESGPNGAVALAKTWLFGVGSSAKSLDTALQGIDALIVALGSGGGANPGDNDDGIEIVFDYSYDTSGFFDDPLPRQILERAAQVFEARIQDRLEAAAYTEISFLNPSNMDETIILEDCWVDTNQIVVFVGADDLDSYSDDILGRGGKGGWYGSPDAGVARGQDNPVGDNATDIAMWGGYISFDNGLEDYDWYYDPDLTTASDINGMDFYTVALHELGHVFGIGTALSWYHLVSDGYFMGRAAMAAYGGRPVPVDAEGGHWADGVVAAMDPFDEPNTRQNFTDLDFAALADIGWEIAPYSASLQAAPLIGVEAALEAPAMLG